MHRYVPSAPLVVDKLLAVAALLAMRILSIGCNPIRQLSMSLMQRRYVALDDPSLETLRLEQLDPQNVRLLLSFSISLIEQLPKGKLSQQERFGCVLKLLTTE